MFSPPRLESLSLHAQADVPMDDAPGSMGEAARASIYADFVQQYGAPANKTAQDLLSAYIEELIVGLKGAAHAPGHIVDLHRHVITANKMVEQIAARALAGFDGASTGPSPGGDQLGLYKDFKRFIIARAQGGRESEDKAKILYLEAQISELQGYLQSNSVDRTRLIDKIQARFLKDANGVAAMKKRKLDWVRKIGEIKTHEAQLQESRIKLGRARVAEALLRAQIACDKKTKASSEKQEDAANARVREEAQRKYNEQKARAAEKDRMAQERLAAAAGDNLKYKGGHNHTPEAAEAAAAAGARKRRNIFLDDEAEEAEEEDDYE